MGVGGGGQHLVSGPEGIEDRIFKNSTPEAVGRGHQGLKRGAGPSKLRGGRGDLKPEQLLRLVTLLTLLLKKLNVPDISFLT